MKWIMFLMFSMEVPPIELKTYKTKVECHLDLRLIKVEGMMVIKNGDIIDLEKFDPITYLCLPAPK